MLLALQPMPLRLLTLLAKHVRRVITSIESGDIEGAGRLLDDMLQGELELFRKGVSVCVRCWWWV